MSKWRNAMNMRVNRCTIRCLVWVILTCMPFLHCCMRPNDKSFDIVCESGEQQRSLQPHCYSCSGERTNLSEMEAGCRQLPNGLAGQYTYRSDNWSTRCQGGTPGQPPLPSSQPSVPTILEVSYCVTFLPEGANRAFVEGTQLLFSVKYSYSESWPGVLAAELYDPANPEKPFASEEGLSKGNNVEFRFSYLAGQNPGNFYKIKIHVVGYPDLQKESNLIAVPDVFPNDPNLNPACDCDLHVDGTAKPLAPQINTVERAATDPNLVHISLIPQLRTERGLAKQSGGAEIPAVEQRPDFYVVSYDQAANRNGRSDIEWENALLDQGKYEIFRPKTLVDGNGGFEVLDLQTPDANPKTFFIRAINDLALIEGNMPNLIAGGGLSCPIGAGTNTSETINALNITGEIVSVAVRSKDDFVPGKILEIGYETGMNSTDYDVDVDTSPKKWTHG